MVLHARDRMGPYEILGPIGSGGSGEVYRARDTSHGRDVAVKVIHEELSVAAHGDRLRRFEQEARATATLVHPNILALFDVGVEGERHYIVEELLDGHSLRELLERGPLSLSQSVDWARQIAVGLAAAHAHGVVHRDLSPGNVFVTNDGQVKILDFGLAGLARPGNGRERAPQEESTAIHDDGVMGTTAYMCPEQVRGLPADPRSDIFALGAVLYEMLSGRRAFIGNSAGETATAILTKEPERLSGRGLNVPPGLEPIVWRCLRKDRDERFQSAREVALALEAIAAPPDPQARRPGPDLWDSTEGHAGRGPGPSGESGPRRAIPSAPKPTQPEWSRRESVQALAVASRAGDGSSAREPPVRAGECVAHYKIIEEIGRGGMGVVFRARDTVLDRDVALKCPWPVLARDPVVRQRFMHEAHAAARLAHPHIVPVFEVLEWDGIPWLAMELIEGRSLRSLLSERGALPLEVILRCSEGLADALHAAHAKRILHRDLNPNNVLLTAEAWPFLTDFGLARVFAPQRFDSGDSTLSQALTGDGHIVGTRCYMSPEQILGQTLDARTDIFSFGAVLYEMCTGFRAFPTSEPGAENDAILHHEPGAIRAINRRIPEDLDRIARKALAKRPDERYQAASDLLADLVGLRRRVESGQHIPGPRPQGRRRARWAAAPVLLAVAAAFLWWKMPSLRTPTRALPAATPRRIATDVGSESEPAISPDGSLIAYVSNGSGTPNTWVVDVKGGNPLRLTDDPYGGRSPAWFPDGSALAFVSDRGGGQGIWKVPRLGGTAVLVVPDAADPALSPDGARMAFTRRDASGYRRVFAAPLVDPTRAVPLSGEGGGHGDHAEPAWSPDGRLVCYADDRNLWLVDVEAGHPRRLTNDSTVDHQPVWSRDGRSVIFTSEREDTQALWRVPASGGVPERLTLGSGPESAASLSHDGSRFAYSTHVHKHNIALVDLGTGRRQMIRSPLDETAPTLAPNGSALVFRSTRQGGRYQVWLQPLSRGSPVGQPRLVTDLAGFVSAPALSPDTRWVAFRREYEGGRSEIWIARTSGGLAERLSDGAGVEWHPAWSPDGSALAWASERGGHCHIWVTPIRDGRRAGPSRQITSGDKTDNLPAWSPDGKEIAYAGDNEREVWIVPVAGNAPPRRVSSGNDEVGRLRWHAQTGWLWFARAEGKAGPQLWKVFPRGGEPVEAVRPDWLQGAAPPGEFDLSADGRLLALTLEEARGDIWILDAQPGAY